MTTRSRLLDFRLEASRILGCADDEGEIIAALESVRDGLKTARGLLDTVCRTDITGKDSDGEFCENCGADVDSCEPIHFADHNAACDIPLVWGER